MNRSCSSSSYMRFIVSACRITVVSFFALLLIRNAVEIRAAETLIVETRAVAAPDANSKILKQAQRALREWRFEAAESLYREILIADEANAEARLGLSFALLKQRKLQDAFEQVTRALNDNPQRARAHSLLGTTLLTIGDFPRAAERFQAALGLDRNDALAIAGLGMIDFYENRVDAAYAKLDRATRIEPNDPDYLFSFAQTAARFERYRVAADSYERFLRVAPRTDEDRRARIRGLIAFLRYISTQGKLYEVAGAAHTEMGFELVNNRPVIAVRVNNRAEPLRFVLDTGSSMCVISDAAARRVGVSAIAQGGMARAVGGVGRFEIVYGFLQELAFGEARARNVPVYIRQFHNAQQPVDGYIGLAVLTRYLTAVDYERRSLMLTRSNKIEPASPVIVPATVPTTTDVTGATSKATPSGNAANDTTATEVFELPARLTTGGFWSGEVRLDGVERMQNFIIDTGASISVVSEGLAAREELSRFQQSTQMRIHGAAGITENVPLLMLPGVALGAHTRPNVPAVVLDMEPINEASGFEQTGIIGGNVLRHFRVTFDFDRMVVRFEPNKNRRTAKPTKISQATKEQR